MKRLPVVAFNGLNADSLGAYLASLGLFSLATRQWPGVRAVWRNARFCLVGGPVTSEPVVEFVSGVGERNAWTRYDRPWEEAKRADVREKTSTRTARWRALTAEERSLRAFGVHLALGGRVKMNPLLGWGGTTGKRDFARGWKNAVGAIEKPTREWSRDALNDDLEAVLSGGPCTCIGSFQAGSWFGAANKIYNHGNPSAPPDSPRGKKQPYREGEISPWAMALACEGLPYFTGGPSRQLGSRRQPNGAFPFVTTAMPPKAEGEAGGAEAEVWAPIWDRPMAEPELRSLFLRGRSELGGKGATSSAAFAAGVVSRGVDAGVAEFRRFLLLHTTSAQTFESRLATVVPVPKTNPDSAATRAIRTIVGLRDALPEDRKVGKRWRFSGLRGPLEQALVDFAAAEPGEGRTEQAWALVDQVNQALVTVDRNRRFRSHRVRFRSLPGEWAAGLFREDPPDRESRLALAVSSLTETPLSAPLIAYRIGVQRAPARSRWEFSESPPGRRVWSDAGPTENLCAVADRRVLEALRHGTSQPPFEAAIRVDLDDVYASLVGEVDEERLALWLDRLSVFDWGGGANRESATELQQGFAVARPTVDGALALYALFRPLACGRLFRRVLQENGILADSASTCAHLGRVVAMLRHDDVNAAAEAAIAAYRSAGVALADFDALPDGTDPQRLLAALTVPVRDEGVLAVFRRWCAPTKPGER